MATNALSNALKLDLNKPLVKQKAEAPVADKKETVAVPKQAVQDDEFGDLSYMSPGTKAAYQRSREALAQKNQADIELAGLKQDLESNVLAEKAKVLQESQKRMKSYVSESEKGMHTIPAFDPKKNDLMDIGKMFSMLATAGIMMGGGGKLASINGMKAMTGMLKGYAAGDQTDYERQYQIYKENVNSLKESNAQILRHLENMMKLEATDKEAALIEREQAIRLTGSSSIIAKQLEAGKYQEAYETAKGVFTILEKNDAAILQAELADKRAQATAKYNRDTQFELQRMKNQQSGSKDAYGFNDIVAVAANEATGSLQNLVMFPAEVSSGFFGGKRLDSLWGAPVNDLVNEMTSDSVQRYNVEVTNLGKFIAQVQKGGRAVTNTDILNTGKQFMINEGDTSLTALTKLASARQALERAIDVKLKSDRTPAGLKEVYKLNKADIIRAVPFTVADINNIANAKDKTKTFAQVFEEMGLTQDKATAKSSQSSSAASSSASSASDNKITAQELSDYARDHGISEKDAKDFLIKQGYSVL